MKYIDARPETFMLFVTLHCGRTCTGLRGYSPPGPRQTYLRGRGWVE